MTSPLYPGRDLQRMMRAVALVVWGVVVWLALRPSTDIETGLSWDKANHALAFLVLTALTAIGWPRLRRLPLVALMMVAGCAIELIQGLPVIGRDADLMDVVADGAGVLLGLIVLAALDRRPDRFDQGINGRPDDRRA